MNQSLHKNSDNTNVSSILQNGWPITFANIKNPPFWISSVACVVLVLFALLLFSLTLVALKHLTLEMLSADPARTSDAVKALLPISAATVGLPLIIWRLVILSRQTATAEAKTQIDRETHYTSIFSKSVEQLGQTREIKETQQRNDIFETLTTTIANIEIRLGGIHSLTRLAEESARDTKKIHNMLLSYVRENSWSNRLGQAATLPRFEKLNSWNWYYEYRMNEVSENTKKHLLEWCEKTKTTTATHRNWAEPLLDTRVDVNEAIDAAFETRQKLSAPVRSAFYEALFVGRVFKSDFMKQSDFERCTFVRCRFEMDGDGKNNACFFTTCRFINCNFSNGFSEINLRASLVIGTSFSQKSAGLITLLSCTISNASFQLFPRCEIDMSFSDVYSSSFSAQEENCEVKLTVRYSGVAHCSFMSLVFAADSNFEDVGMAEVILARMTMSEVNTLTSEALASVIADAQTQHPRNLDRPVSWPLFEVKI